MFIRKPLLLILAFFVFNSNVAAQLISRKVVCTGASTYATSEMILTYTIGEAIGDLFSNDLQSVYLTAGFSQPDQSIREILESNDYINPNFTVFPNPALQSPSVKLTFRSLPVGKYSISLFDASGKLCMKREHLNYTPYNFAYQEFTTTGLAHGVYYFRITGDSGFTSSISFIN